MCRNCQEKKLRISEFFSVISVFCSENAEMAWEKVNRDYFISLAICLNFGCSAVWSSSNRAISTELM